MINDVNSILSGNGDFLYKEVKTPAYIFDYDRFGADLDRVKNGLKLMDKQISPVTEGTGGAVGGMGIFTGNTVMSPAS